MEIKPKSLKKNHKFVNVWPIFYIQYLVLAIRAFSDNVMFCHNDIPTVFVTVLYVRPDFSDRVRAGERQNVGLN